jgi:hypothetical protein
MEATARQTPIGAAATHYAIALVALALLALLIWLMLRNRPRGVRKLGHCHAAASYSLMRPPSSSYLRMRPAGADADADSSGG